VDNRKEVVLCPSLVKSQESLESKHTTLKHATHFEDTTSLLD